MVRGWTGMEQEFKAGRQWVIQTGDWDNSGGWSRVWQQTVGRGEEG